MEGDDKACRAHAQGLELTLNGCSKRRAHRHAPLTQVDSLLTYLAFSQADFGVQCIDVLGLILQRASSPARLSRCARISSTVAPYLRFRALSSARRSSISASRAGSNSTREA